MTGSGTGGRAALEQDGVLRADGAEADSALLKIEGLSKAFGGPDVTPPPLPVPTRCERNSAATDHHRPGSGLG
jgi:hypothetical protein